MIIKVITIITKKYVNTVTKKFIPNMLLTSVINSTLEHNTTKFYDKYKI